jgi:hypothetical protein
MLNAAAFLVGEDRRVVAADGFAEAVDQPPRLLRLALIAPADEQAERIGFAKEGEFIIRNSGIREADEKGERGRGQFCNSGSDGHFGVLLSMPS